MQKSLQYSDRDQFIIDNISLLTGLSFEQVRQVFEFLLIFQMTDYMGGKSITIPYLGEVTVTYEKDEIIRGHKQAVLNTKFKDSKLLKRMIGEIEDGENTTILAIFKRFIENQLLYVLQEDSTSGPRKQTRKSTKKREFSFPKSFYGTGKSG